MVNFKFVPLDESRISDEHRKQFLKIGQLVEWNYADTSGAHSGLVIIGEKAIAQGFQTFADVTINVGATPLTMPKVQEISRIVSTELQQRMVMNYQKPGNA